MRGRVCVSANEIILRIILKKITVSAKTEEKFQRFRISQRARKGLFLKKEFINGPSKIKNYFRYFG